MEEFVEKKPFKRASSDHFLSAFIKTFFSHISLTVLLNALVKPAWILTEFWVHNQIGHEAWGSYAALLSFAFLFIALSDLGINQYATQKLASDPALLRSYFPQMLGIKLVLVAFYPLAMWGLGYIWGFTFEELFLLVLLAFIYGGTQLKQFYRSNFQALQAFNIDAFASVTERAILLVLAWVLLYTYIDIERFVYARLLAIALSILIFSIILRQKQGYLGIALKKKGTETILRASFSFALVTVLYSFLDKVDQVMLEKICGDRETSLYAAAYRWMDALQMYLIIILTIFFARFAHFIKDYTTQSKLLRLAQVLVALPLIFISSVVFFHGELFIELLFTQSSPSEINSMTYAFKILFISTLANGFLLVYSTLLSATGSIPYINKVIVGGILFNVGLNLYLIPQQGASGAAWATTLTLNIMGICYLGRVYWEGRVRIPWDLIGKMLGLTFFLWGCLYGFRQLEVLPWVSIMASGGIFLLACLLLRVVPEEVLPWKR